MNAAVAAKETERPQACNGRVGRLEKWKLVLATVLATMIVMGGESGTLPALAAKLIEILGR